MDRHLLSSAGGQPVICSLMISSYEFTLGFSSRVLHDWARERSEYAGGDKLRTVPGYDGNVETGYIESGYVGDSRDV